MDKEKNVVAHFKARYYTLTVEIEPYSSNGRVSPAGGKYDPGTEVTLTATPYEPFYIFEGWSGDASGSTRSVTITMDKSKIVHAAFVDPEDVFSQVCNSTGVNNAAVYGATEGIHPAQFLSSSDNETWETDMVQLVGRVPTEYLAKAIAETELVVCSRLSYEFVESCWYSGSGTSVEVKRYRTKADIELREARTAEIIANTTMYAEPDPCPPIWHVIGSETNHTICGIPSWDQLYDWLRAYIE